MNTYVFISLLVPEDTRFHTNTFYFFSFFVQMSKVLSKKTCRLFSARNYLDKCCFSHKSVGKLYSCATKSLNKYVNEWAVNMQNSKLLAKPSDTDMTATEAKYHKNYLRNMYNKFKDKQKNAAVEKELLSTIECIYTQFSNLCVHKTLWFVNQPVFTIAYPDDLKLS